MKFLSNPRLWQTLLGGYWLTMAIGTHLPQLPAPPGGIEWDKALHFTGFMGLAGLLALAVTMPKRRLTFALATKLWLIVLAYGALDELTQPYFGRSCDLLDWIADALGAATGLGIVAAWQRRTKRGKGNAE